MSAVMKVAKKDLSLMELMGNAHEQIDHYRSLLGQARQSREDATLAIFRAGEWLSLARKKFKAEGRGKWTAFLKENGIPQTTGWEAETLFKKAKTEEAVGGMTPTEAKRTFKVVKQKKTTSEPSVPSVKTSRATADSGNFDGVTVPMTPRRFGEPPSDPDQDWRPASPVPSYALPGTVSDPDGPGGRGRRWRCLLTVDCCGTRYRTGYRPRRRTADAWGTAPVAHHHRSDRASARSVGRGHRQARSGR